MTVKIEGMGKWKQIDVGNCLAKYNSVQEGGNGKEGKGEEGTFERVVYTKLFASHFHFPPFPFFLLAPNFVPPNCGESSHSPYLTYLHLFLDFLLHQFFECINFADYVDFEETTVLVARLRQPSQLEGI
jgi:hypothetical protein